MSARSRLDEKGALALELGGGITRGDDTIAGCRQTRNDWRRSPAS